MPEETEIGDKDDRNLVTYVIFILEYNWEQMKYADFKSSVLLGLAGTLVALSFSISLSWNLFESREPYLIILLIFAALNTISAIEALRVIVPTLGLEEPETHVFFEGILTRARQEYVQEVLSLKEEILAEDLLNEAYTLASIQKNKYHHIIISSKILVGSIMFLVISICTLLSIEYLALSINCVFG